MKKDIHPDYNKTTIKCVCGNEIATGSVEENITVEICNNCQEQQLFIYILSIFLFCRSFFSYPTYLETRPAFTTNIFFSPPT